MPLIEEMSTWSSYYTTPWSPNEWARNIPHFRRSFTWWLCAAPNPRASWLFMQRLGVTFGKQLFLACLRVEMGIRTVRLRNATGFLFFTKRKGCLDSFCWGFLCGGGARRWRDPWPNASMKEVGAPSLRCVWFLAHKIAHRTFWTTHVVSLDC